MRVLFPTHKVLSVLTRQQRTHARVYVLMDDRRTIWPTLESADWALADWAEFYFQSLQCPHLRKCCLAEIRWEEDQLISSHLCLYQKGRCQLA